MTWAAWRQHRISLLVGLATLLALGGLLLASGLSMRQGFDRLGLDRCPAPIDANCPDAAHQFAIQYSGQQSLLALLLLLPALVGLFWGAPLVAREVEHGTHRVAWLQSVTRTRWLLVKVLVLSVAAVVGVGAFTAMLRWWMNPLLEVRQEEFEPIKFDLLGVVPIAYALAALMIGIAAGTVTKKTLPALALTLALFAGVRIAVSLELRPNYMAPVTGSFAMPSMAGDTDSQLPVGWYLVQQTVDRDGSLISDGVGFEHDAVVRACPDLDTHLEPPPAPQGATVQRVPNATMTALERCAARMGFHVEASYQPEDRFWRFQITEALLYLTLAGALLAGTVWWIRHRVV